MPQIKINEKICRYLNINNVNNKPYFNIEGLPNYNTYIYG